MMLKPRPGSAGAPVKINYKFPNWCSKAPPGTHIDVMKDDKLMEKLLIGKLVIKLFPKISKDVPQCPQNVLKISLRSPKCPKMSLKFSKKVDKY